MHLPELFAVETLLDWRTAFELLVEMCETIDHAHTAGISELQVLPESFYITRSQRGGWRAQLLDAEVEDLRRSEPKDTDVMRAPPWTFALRCDYFSPEQIMGKPLRPPHEVYSLGVIVFELIAGKRPFDAARGPAGLITAMLRTVPPLASAIAPDAGIPLAVDLLLARCLDKDVGKRIANARQLATLAVTVLGTEPVVPLPVVRRPDVPPPASTSNPTPPPKRRRTPPPRSAKPIVAILPASPCSAKGCPVPHRFGMHATKTIVGAWLYLDHFDSALSRRPEEPHPHAGVATVSYLFDGRLVHRDSLGNVQTMERGGVSWMLAGAGVVHAEQHVERTKGARVHGIELLVALPRPNEDDPPAYAYHRAADLPSVVIGGVRVRVVIGDGFGAHSPLVTPASLSLFDARLPAGSAIPIPQPRYHEYQRAVYVVSGAIEIEDTKVEARNLVVFSPTASIGVRASGGKPAHIIGLASAPVVGPRCNLGLFSSSSKGRAEEAKRRWEAGELGTIPGA